jgi:hypothetical protein
VCGQVLSSDVFRYKSGAVMRILEDKLGDRFQNFINLLFDMYRDPTRSGKKDKFKKVLIEMVKKCRFGFLSCWLVGWVDGFSNQNACVRVRVRVRVRVCVCMCVSQGLIPC